MEETLGNDRKESCSLDLRGHWLINLNDKPFCFVLEQNTYSAVCVSQNENHANFKISKKTMLVQRQK